MLISVFQSRVIDYILVTPGNSLYFPAVEFIKGSIGRAGVASSHLPVVVDCRFILGRFANPWYPNSTIPIFQAA